MEFVKISCEEYNKVVPLFSSYFDERSPKKVISLLVHEVGHKNLFVLKEGKKIIGSVCLGLRDDGHAEMSHFVGSDEIFGSLFDVAVAHCHAHGAVSISTVIPRLQEPMLARKGFFLDQGKSVMGWKRKDEPQQSNLKETLDEVSAMDEIMGTTAERLRKLKLR
jgi:hypothetical protein